ncbi:glycosyltransferase family 4 protein [Patescibacteria group bacterium]
MENNQVQKKILIFSTAYLPMVGGAEIAVKEITDRLPSWKFDMITPKIQFGLPKFEKIGNINVYRIGFGCNFDKFLLPVFGLFKANRLNKRNNYNLTWSIMASYGGFLGSFFKKFHSDKPFLLTLQEGDAPELILEKVGFFKSSFKKIFKRADYIQSISSFLDNWAEKMGIDSNKRVIVPNGVDSKKFATELIHEHIHDHKIILTVSRLVKKNGVDDLIKAGQYLNFDFKIIIIGSGKNEKKLKKLVKKLKLENKVIFQGQIKYGELPKYYALADVFVRPSLSEGLGNVFLEAMACGLPVIGTPVGGIPDFLEDRKTGLFCKVNNPQSIAKKIEEILKDNKLRKNIVNNGLNLIKEKYTWNGIAKKMERVFDKLL